MVIYIYPGDYNPNYINIKILDLIVTGHLCAYFLCNCINKILNCDWSSVHLFLT